MKKIKILFLSKDAIGGTKTFLNHISQLNTRRFTKYFLIFYPKNLLNRKFELVHFLIDAFKLINSYRRNKPHIIFTLNIYASALVSVTRKLLKLPHICLINIDIQRVIENKSFFVQSILKILFSRTCNSADLVIFVSNDLMLASIKNFNLDPLKCRVIYNGVSPKYFSNSSPNKKNKTFKIVTAGRLEKQKDFETVVKAFNKIRRSCNAELFIIGDGSLKPKLRNLAIELKVSTNTHFLGWKKNFERYLTQADLLVFSSNYEGFGRVISEAMALKIPVVSTDTLYGPGEILGRGKYGVLIPVGNYKIMAENIIDLIHNPKKSALYAHRAYRRAQLFRLGIFLQNYENLFEEIVI